MYKCMYNTRKMYYMKIYIQISIDFESSTTKGRPHFGNGVTRAICDYYFTIAWEPSFAWKPNFLLKSQPT